MFITTKGQVTIPAEIREKFGFLPHTEIEFIIANNKVVLRKARHQARGKKVIDRLRGTATVKMTTDEIMKLTRGE